jgi:hypothetical protein
MTNPRSKATTAVVLGLSATAIGFTVFVLIPVIILLMMLGNYAK